MSPTQKDDARGRLWGGLMAVLFLFLMGLKIYGVPGVTWPRMMLFMLIVGALLGSLIFNMKGKDSDSGGSVLLIGLLQLDWFLEQAVNGAWYAATDQMLAMQLLFGN